MQAAFSAACLKRSLPAACRRRGVPAAFFRESGVRSAVFRERGVPAAIFRERGVTAAIFRERGVPAALFRENTLLHYKAYCVANRDVILSRRACGASKNLPRPPRSSCNATTLAFLPLSFRLSERQRTHGEISHIVRLFLQCTLARIHFSSLYIIPRRFLDCARLHPCSARNDMLRRGCRPRFTRFA